MEESNASGYSNFKYDQTPCRTWLGVESAKTKKPLIRISHGSGASTNISKPIESTGKTHGFSYRVAGVR